MTDPLYLTDAERPLRPPALRDRFTLYATFSWKGIRYTRWFCDATARAAYLAELEGVTIQSTGHLEPSQPAAALGSIYRKRGFE